jgi:hypothetical protein
MKPKCVFFGFIELNDISQERNGLQWIYLEMMRSANDLVGIANPT